jgi:NAD(P)-dependent dehydrogenase (short-subunit alcohol dehydrogenase family)
MAGQFWAIVNSQAELDALVAQIEVAGDVRDEAVAKSLVQMAVDRFGGLGIAFNNARILGEMGSVTDKSLSGWRDTLDTNLTSAFLGARYQVPAMIERGAGTLIFTSSFVGYSAGMPGMAAYSANKAALTGMTQCLAVELGAKGIREITRGRPRLIF